MNNDNPFFSGSKPNLISDKVMKKLDKVLKNNNTNNVTVSSHLSNIYENYIKPNLFAIFVFIIIVIFLFMRYIVKKYKEENKDDEPEIEDTETESESELNDTNQNEMINDTESSIIDTSDNNKNNQNNQNNEINFYTLKDQYEQMLEQNNGMVSDQFIMDSYARNSEKLAFNEMSKIIAQGGSDN